MCVVSHLHLSSLIFLKDKAELIWVSSCYQPQKKRTLTQRKLLEQICRKSKRTKKNISFRFVNYTYFLNNKLVSRCLFLTLSITVCLPVQGKLAGIVQHHELLQQALDDFCGGVLRANVDLLHTVRRQVEGGSLVTGLAVHPLLAFWCCLMVATYLPGFSLWARCLHSQDCNWSTEPQMDLDEASIGTIWSLKCTNKGEVATYFSMDMCTSQDRKVLLYEVLPGNSWTFCKMQYSLDCRVRWEGWYHCHLCMINI